MKKLLIAVAFAFLLIAAVATTALADNGPHGGFSSANYEKCAGCHRAHSAQSADGFILKSADVTELCLACHEGGAGAYTDVANGIYHAANIATLASPLGAQGDRGAPLFGGGFKYTQAVHTWNGKSGYAQGDAAPSTGTAITSSHTVAGITALSIGNGTVWGSGNIGDHPAAEYWNGTTATLECTSCHDPHGKAGRFENNTNTAPTLASWSANVTSSPTVTTENYGTTYTVYGGVANGTVMASYRLLRFTAEGSRGFEAAGGTTNATLGYTPSQLWWRTGNTQTTAGMTIRESRGFRKTELTSVATYTNPYWYTPNSDYTKDNTVQVYRSRYDSANSVWTAWESYVSQPGDASGRTFSVKRPALGDYASGAAVTDINRYLPVSSGVVGTVYTCNSAGTTGLKTGVTLPDYTTFPTGAGRTQSAMNTAGAYYPCTVGTGGPSDVTRFDNSGPRGQVSFFCAECHDRYLAASLSTTGTASVSLNSRTSDSGDTVYKFRHSAGGSVSCTDCHYAHGTSAIMTATNSTYPEASLVTFGSAASTDSALLKLDERSMCAKCHGGDVNFAFTTNTAP